MDYPWFNKIKEIPLITPELLYLMVLSRRISKSKSHTRKIKPSMVIPSHPINMPTSKKRLHNRIKKLKAGKPLTSKGPIKVVKNGSQYRTVNGAGRITAYHRTKINKPIDMVVYNAKPKNVKRLRLVKNLL